MSAVQPFTERHRAIINSLGKRLEAFLEDPNEENLHDLRTSVRRADASVSALPKRFAPAGRPRGCRASWMT